MERETGKEPLTPLEVFKWAIEQTLSNQLKSMGATVPFEPSLEIHDIGLKGSRWTEDKLYAQDSVIRKNIRRGNGIIVQLSPKSLSTVSRERMVNYNGKDSEITMVNWARRGMEKFFDIKLEFLQQNKSLGTQGSFFGNSPMRQAGYQEAVRKTIFHEIEESILHSGASIDIYRLSKANGENAQVSYFPSLDSWIVSSKNVTVAVRDKEDLKCYNLDRYQFSNVIADT